MSEKTSVVVDVSSSRFLQAYQDLRDLIVSGELRSNVRLTEAELTKLLDVSRGTVRSVTARLAQEGYLTSEPNRGVRTRSFTIDEAAEILEAREVLEPALAAKAAECATDEELEKLTVILEKMAVADRQHIEAEYSGLNRRFHQTIRDAARQATMSSFVDSLHYPLVMRQYRDLTTAHPRKSSLNEHRAILYALLTRNADAARAAMKHHVASARQALLFNSENVVALHLESSNEHGPAANDGAAVTDRGVRRE